MRPSHETPSFSPPKKMVVFSLEDVLVPGPNDPNVNPKQVKSLLKSAQSYAQKQGVILVVISGYTEKVAREKMNEFGLNAYFSPENVFAVHPSYLAKMSEVDRSLYEAKCQDNLQCKDEYFRQVKLLELMEERYIAPENVLLVGHDYWFDGFYTRRFSKVDVVFIESALSSRGKKPEEKIEGLWYASRKWAPIKKIIEGKASKPNYNFLDTYVNITMTSELFGGKGIPGLKRVIIERRKKDSRDFTAISPK